MLIVQLQYSAGLGIASLLYLNTDQFSLKVVYLHTGRFVSEWKCPQAQQCNKEHELIKITVHHSHAMKTGTGLHYVHTACIRAQKTFTFKRREALKSLFWRLKVKLDKVKTQLP